MLTNVNNSTHSVKWIYHIIRSILNGSIAALYNPYLLGETQILRVVSLKFDPFFCTPRLAAWWQIIRILNKKNNPWGKWMIFESVLMNGWLVSKWTLTNALKDRSMARLLKMKQQGWLNVLNAKNEHNCISHQKRQRWFFCYSSMKEFPSQLPQLPIKHKLIDIMWNKT